MIHPRLDGARPRVLILLVGTLVLGCEAGPSPAAVGPVAVDAPPAPETSAPPAVASTLERLRATLGLPTLARARVYAINLHVEHPGPDEELFGEGGALNPDRAPEAGAVMSPEQLERFVAAMRRPHGLVGGAYCYYPHHGVVLEDEGGAVLASISICLMCMRFYTEVAGLGPVFDVALVRELFDELGVPTQFPVDGLPPAPRRPVVEREVRRVVRACLGPRLRESGGPRSVTLDVGPDGVVRALAGVDDRTRRCALKRLNHGGRRGFTAVPILPASRDGGSYEVELEPGREPE